MMIKIYGMTLLAAAIFAAPQWAQDMPDAAPPDATFVPPPATEFAVQPAAYQAPSDNPPQSNSAPASVSSPLKLDALPNSAGQVWRQYDLRGYTQRITTTQNPQQTIVDWILRETGTEMWFNEPLGILSASRDQLYVYHTPEIHAVVERVVQNFVQSQGQPQVLGIRLLTVGSPNWRSGAYSMLQPIDVRTNGIEGWMISKENAAILINQLRRRTDYTEHGGGDFTAHAGQKMVITQTRPIEYIKAIRWNQGRFPAFETIPARLDEGYTIDISALVTPDGAIESLLHCEVDQVEKMQQVDVDVPIAGGGAQAVRVGVPQLVNWRIHERFRWPAGQVLLLSCGVVANPAGSSANWGIGDLFSGSRGRADALLMIEYKGIARPTPAARQAQSQLVPVDAPR